MGENTLGDSECWEDEEEVDARWVDTTGVGEVPYPGGGSCIYEGCGYAVLTLVLKGGVGEGGSGYGEETPLVSDS
jgi:hypothetical protein